jgi:hypothetical protein
MRPDTGEQGEIKRAAEGQKETITRSRADADLPESSDVASRGAAPAQSVPLLIPQEER